MPKTCARCRAVSETGQGYLDTGGGKAFCPLCYPKRAAERAKGTLLFLPISLVLGTLIGQSSSPFRSAGWAIVNYTLILISWSLLVLPHELGHALVGRLLGRRIVQVAVGAGPLLWKTPFLGGTLEICAYPFGGITRSIDCRVAGFRFRLWATVLGGPLVNLLVALAIFPFLPRPFRFGSLGQGAQIPWDLFLGSLIVLVWNLVPRRIRTLYGRNPSDGLSLVRVPFLTPAEVRREASIYFLVLGSPDLEARRYAEARRHYESGLELFPESLLLKNDLAVAKLRSGDISGAREDFSSLVAAAGTEPQNRLLAMSNVAAADLLLDRPELLPEADRYSQEAMKSLAWNLAVKGTRAAVLIALGTWDEGLALARETLELQTTASGKANNACTLAVGFKGKGQDEEARKALALAEQLDPACPSLSRVRATLGLPTAPSGNTQ